MLVSNDLGYVCVLLVFHAVDGIDGGGVVAVCCGPMTDLLAAVVVCFLCFLLNGFFLSGMSLLLCAFLW